MMTSLVLRIAVFVCVCASAAAQSSDEIAGRWVGSVDTDRGQMEIALVLEYDGATFSGEVRTVHGGWPVTSVTSKDEQWTIVFGTTKEGGTMKGRVSERRFRGDWTTHMAAGTFDLVQARRR